MTNLQEIKTLEAGISVILCTYNGADKLPQTIKALAQQQVPPEIPWEIIFIDNNSSDNSSEIATASWEALSEKLDVPFISLSETIPGKYYALNKGLRNAKFSYFIIVDDDNWLNPNYVAQAFKSIDGRPEIGAIGSRTEAAFEADNPRDQVWLNKKPERFAIGEQGSDGDVTYRKHLWGAGLVSRTELYLRIYDKYPSFLIDYSTKNILVVEDTEYCLRLILRGFRLYYASELKLFHFVPNERLTKEYWTKLNSNIDRSFEVIDVYYMAVKVYSDKYKNPLLLLRLKLLTHLRFRTRTGIKKQRQRILLGLLFPESAYNTPLIDAVRRFIQDDELPRNTTTME